MTDLSTARPVDAAGHPRWRDSLLIGLAALAWYLLLQQDTLYKTDGHYQLVQVHGGRIQHPLHFLYSPVLYVWMQLLDLLGVSIYRAGTLLSAVSMAIGVTLSHRGFAGLGLTPRRCILAAALVATAPAIVFFATIVELHGVFFALASLAFLAAVRLVRKPTIPRGLALGLATGLAYLAHATGVLLVPMLAGMCVALSAERGRHPRAMMWPLLAAGAAYLVVMIGVPRALHITGFTVSVERASSHFFVNARRNLGQLQLYPLALWQDWGWRFLPLSLAWIPAAFVAGNRLLGLVFAASVVMYTTATLGVMGAESEWGAYVLPLVWIAALLVVRQGPTWWTALVLAGCLGVGVVQVAQHDTMPSLPFAEGLAATVGDRPAIVIIGNHMEVEGVLVHNPGVLMHILLEWAEVPADLMQAHGLRGIDAWVQQQWEAGREVYLTDGARAFLLDPEFADQRPSGPVILQHFESAYRLEPVANGGFVADRLHPN